MMKRFLTSLPFFNGYSEQFFMFRTGFLILQKPNILLTFRQNRLVDPRFWRNFVLISNLILCSKSSSCNLNTLEPLKHKSWDYDFLEFGRKTNFEKCSRNVDPELMAHQSAVHFLWTVHFSKSIKIELRSCHLFGWNKDLTLTIRFKLRIRLYLRLTFAWKIVFHKNQNLNHRFSWKPTTRHKS